MQLISLISLLALGAIATAIPVDAVEATDAITESTDESTAAAHNSCNQSYHVTHLHYEINADGFTDGNKWRDVCLNLHNAMRAQSCAPTSKGCTIDGKGNLHWWFNDSLFCTKKKVEHAWWQVTHNDQGTIEC